ncbi:hypothetical protein IWW50_005243 [Coemansia erecta]|nr:hypothetical protein GGF43_000013 [Coemansia sp. RSA 2618]KAJ2819994.1 hypothetical protein IWW50_005243 [Coemansia erecta]
MYPPPQHGYSDDIVERARQMSIKTTKRQGIIYGGIEVAFTVLMAALLGVYIKRAQDNRDSNGNWYTWYIWLLVALLVLNALCAAYTIWRTVSRLRWLKDPNTPRELIMAGFNPDGAAYGYGGATVIVQQPNQGYYQPPPPTYAPDGNNQNAYNNQNMHNNPYPPQDHSYLYGSGKQ